MCEALQLNWKLPNTSGTKKISKKSKSMKPRPAAKAAQDEDGVEIDGKYTLRACSIKKRIETEGRKTQPRKRGPKPRPRPLPMSKYRRKTANLRERQRMGEINVAFDKLKDKIPTPIITGKGKCEKLTKINILHVAINYIRALENILDTGDAGMNMYGTSIVQSPFLDLPLEERSSGHDTDMGDASDVPSSPRDAIQLTATIKKGKNRNKSESSGNSSGDDSGFMEDSDDPNPVKSFQENTDALQGPDWTELSSSLDFQPFKINPAPPPPPTLDRGNLDTLLTTSAIVSPTNHPNKSLFSTLIACNNRRVLQPKHFNNQQTPEASGFPESADAGGTSAIGEANTGSGGGSERGSGFIGGLDVGMVSAQVVDLINELACNLDDSLEGFEDFNFSVDPFEIMI